MIGQKLVQIILICDLGPNGKLPKIWHAFKVKITNSFHGLNHAKCFLIIFFGSRILQYCVSEHTIFLLRHFRSHGFRFSSCRFSIFWSPLSCLFKTATATLLKSFKDKPNYPSTKTEDVMNGKLPLCDCAFLFDIHISRNV